VITRAVQSLRLRLLDAADHVTRRDDPLIPPRRQQGFVGDSDFRATGEEFLQYFKDLGGLQPHERVLDVGCGIGRMARPLTDYIRPPGAYEGFDVVPEGIAWCQRRYARAFPHFHFRLADVTNALYNPDAGVPAREYTFPYPDASFDFAFACSVFTHLLPDDADRYLAEMSRVTRPEGSIFATFFLLGPETARAGFGDGRLSFPHDHGNHATDSAETPESAVAYQEEWVRHRLAAHGLSPVESFRYGTWSGRTDGLSLQDIVIARPLRG
jgi:SAM-dependent methyltransferase